jgi:hypothetical protein
MGGGDPAGVGGVELEAMRAAADAAAALLAAASNSACVLLSSMIERGLSARRGLHSGGPRPRGCWGECPSVPARPPGRLSYHCRHPSAADATVTEQTKQRKLT